MMASVFWSYASQAAATFELPERDLLAVLIDELYGQRTFNDTHRVELEEPYEGRYGNFVGQTYLLNDSQWGVFNMSLLTRTPEFRQAVL